MKAFLKTEKTHHKNVNMGKIMGDFGFLLYFLFQDFRNKK